MAETALPPLPEGFVLDKPANDNALPPLPEGFTLDAPVASAKLPALPDGFKLDTDATEPGIVDKIGQPITDPKQAEAMANAQGAGVLEGAKNLAKGIGERFVQLEGGAVRDIATVLPGSDPVSDFIYWATGTEKPANYPTPEEVTKTGQEVAKQMENVDLGFEEGDSWEDVKKAPASKFLPWAFKQGLLSAPDMALAMASLPGYAAIRSGELAQDRAENDQRSDATVDDMLKTAPAAVVSGLLDRIGGRAMFGLDDVAVQGLKQIPKETAKAAIKEGVTEGLQEGIESTATTAGTEKGFDPWQTAEQMLAGTLAGGVTGGTVRAGTGTIEAASNTETPVEGDQGETVEPETPPLQVPVTQDGGEERASPLDSSSPSASPEERAILRRTSMPDEDIDAMSPEERAAKVAEARAAGIRVNGAMVRAAEQYQRPAAAPVPENVLVPEERPVEQPVDAKAAAQRMLQDYQTRKARDQQMDAEAEQRVQEIAPELSARVLRSVYEDTPQEPMPRPETPVEARPDPKAIAARQIAQYQARNADAAQAFASAQPELESAVRASVAEDQAQDARVDQALGAPLAVQVQRSLYEDTVSSPNGDTSYAQQRREAIPRIGGPRVVQDVAGNVGPLSQPQQPVLPQLRGPGDNRIAGVDGLRELPQGGRVTPVAQAPVGPGGQRQGVLPGKSPLGDQARAGLEPAQEPSPDGAGRDIATGGMGQTGRVGAIDNTLSALNRDVPRGGSVDQKARTRAVRKGRLNEQGFPVDVRGAVKKPDSLIEFLARKGGVREDRGELSTLGLRDRKTGFVVGSGPLIRPKGMHPDKAREAAAEAGYLPMESSLADFYDALDADARSGRQQFSEYDQDWSAAWREGQGIEQRAAEEDAALSTEQEVRDRLASEGFPVEGSDDFIRRVASRVDAGETLDDAVESAYLEAGSIVVEPTETVADIPFFGDDVEVQPRAASESRALDREAGERDVEPREESRVEEARADRPLRGEGRPEAESDGSREDGGRSNREGESQRPAPVKAPVASWVIRDKATGEAVLETFEKRTADAINKEKYEAVPIQEHLASLNKKPQAQPSEETGADNKPQLIIPGAERATDADIAQRRADAPLKPKAPQKDPGGLFSDEMDQKDLLDQPVEPKRPKPPATVYHGTSSGGFDSFDTYQGKYGLFGSGGYFTEDPEIALEYTRKGRGTAPTVYRAKVDIKNPLDMDAPADVQAWVDAFPDYIDRSDLVDFRPPTNENAYRVVEENLSQDMIPDYEGAETMQEGLRAMGHDGVTHIGGGRHKASKGTKHRVWIAFDPEQVSDLEEESRQYSANPAGWDFADAGEPAPKLSEAEQKRVVDIVSRTAGIDPSFIDSIKVPAGTKALQAWGKGDEEGSTAAGFYSPMRDVITLALDTAPVRAGKVAYHESFHRLQNLFLNDKERKLLKANDARLRKMIADKGEYPAKTVEAMSRKEVEAEAFGIWADSQDNAGVHIGIRKVWKNIRDMLTRVRNYLKGQGYQTVEDVFGKAKSGEIAKRPKQESKSDGKDYAIVDRAPDAPAKPKTSVPTTPKPKTRFSDRLDAYSKAIAAKMKSKGGKFDRLTEGDEETFGDLATRKVLDYLDPVLKMQQKVGGDLNDLSDAYLTARLAEGTIRHELHQVDEKYVQPAIKELAAVGATEKDLHEYLYAMHAPERNRVVGLRNEPDSDLYKAATDPSIRGASGMSTNEAKQILAELAKDRQKFMGIRRAASHIRAMLDDGLKRQLKAGLINKATYDELTQQWQHYVPLRAESDTEGTGGGMPSKSRGFDVRGDEFKGATGRYTKADNVVNYAVNNAEQSIIRAEKNKAATAALRFINQFDPQGESIAKVYWSEDPEKLGDITKAPPVYKRVLGKDGKVTNQRVNAFQMKDDVLAAKVGGKTYYMQFADPKVGLALKKMTFGELGATMRMLKTVSNWQSLINTRANPAFIPINFLRDVQTGATIAMSKDFKAGEIAKMVGSIPKAWGALWRDARGKPGNGKWDKVVADFKANGGKISFDQYNTIEETAKKIQKDLAKASSRGIAGKTWRGFIDLVENLNDTIENGIRVAIYNGAIEQGKTPKRAAFLARDMTVDFQKKGEITPHMNSLYTFFNASVQGNTNFAKALYKSRKVKVAMGALVMAGYAQHVINSALAGDDDDGENAYKKMLRNEPWTFERNIVLFLPGSKDYIKIPLGFGMNAFWHLGSQAGAITTGDKGFLDGTLDSIRVAFDAFNPLGSGGWVSMALPSVIDPIWELGTNQNFSGNPIYPQENQFDPAPPPKSEQAFSSTHPAFRWGAETLNKISGGSDKLPGAVDVYPDSLEYLWGWFTGGVGRFAAQTAETAQRGVEMDFEPKKTPFIRSFYGAVDDQGKRSEYFAQREKVQYVAGKVKEFKEAGDEEGLKDFIADNEQDYAAVKAYEVAEKQRRRINKLRRKNEKRPDAADDLKALDEQELEIMNQARKAYFEAKPDAAE